MTRQELSEAIKTFQTPEELTGYLLGLPESELKTLHLSPLKKHTIKYGFDITTGEIGKLLKETIELDKKRPHFERIGNAAITPISWIAKGILESGALSMIFGDSGTFKSFIAIALSACIATGHKFYGHPVKKGAVFYIAAEGGAGIIRRFRAWSQEYAINIKNAPLYRYTGAVNLCEAAETLINALEDVIEGETETPILAVLDTWSRGLGGDDSDTSAATEGLHKLDTIRSQFPGLAIVIVHHTGHREKSRARGAYLLHAAVDSEFRIEKQTNGNIIFTNTKSKESELLPPMIFKARGVKLLADDGRFLLNDNKEIETSAILEAIDFVPSVTDVTGLGKNQKRILEVLNNKGKQGMTIEELLKNIRKCSAIKKDAFDKAVLSLEEHGLIHHEEGFIHLDKPKEKERF